MITSVQNELVKRLANLKTAKGRRESDTFLLEGEKWVREALRRGLSAKLLVHCPEICQLPPEAKNIKTVTVEEHVFKKISDVETPQGLALELPLPTLDLSVVLSHQKLRAVACWGVQDPGNLGAVIRTALAFAFDAVFCVDSADPYSPKALRGSAAASLWLPVVSSSAEEFLKELKARGVRSLATAAHGGTPYTKADWSAPFVLFVGSEGQGLPEIAAQNASELISIPLAGNVESLNAAVAAALLIAEAARKNQG